jgi:hypothetical protein
LIEFVEFIEFTLTIHGFRGSGFRGSGFRGSKVKKNKSALNQIFPSSEKILAV